MKEVTNTPVEEILHKAVPLSLESKKSLEDCNVTSFGFSNIHPHRSIFVNLKPRFHFSYYTTASIFGAAL